MVAALLAFGLSTFVLTQATSTPSSPARASTAVLTTCGYGPLPAVTTSQVATVGAAGRVVLADVVVSCSKPRATTPTTVDPQPASPSGPSFDTGGTVARTETSIALPLVLTASLGFLGGLALLVFGVRRSRRASTEAR